MWEKTRRRQGLKVTLNICINLSGICICFGKTSPVKTEQIFVERKKENFNQFEEIFHFFINYLLFEIERKIR